MAKIFEAKWNSEVPFYSFLKNYSWLPDYLKVEKTRRKLQSIKEEIRQVNAQPADREAVTEWAKNSLENLKKRRVAWLTQHFTRNRNAKDVFGYLARDSMGVSNFPPLVEWDEIEAAISQLPDQDGIGEGFRIERLQDLAQEMRVIEGELKQLSPKEYFMVNNAQILCDIREEFVNFWRSRQRKFCAPANPRGFRLEISPQEEQDAWSDLGLHKAINPRGFEPDPGR